MAYETKADKIRRQMEALCAAVSYLDSEQEQRLKAELLIKFGLSQKKAQEYIDALIISGRITRIKAHALGASEGT